MTMNIANPVMHAGAIAGSHAKKAESQNEFSASLAGARDESKAPENALLKQNDGFRIPRARMEAFCTNTYNEAASIANGVVLRLLVEGPEELRRMFADPDNRAVVEESLDRLEQALDILERDCGDFLPADAMEEVRGMRDALGRLREAMRMNLWEQVEALAEMLWDGLSALGSALRSVGAEVLPLIRNAAEGALQHQH